MISYLVTPTKQRWNGLIVFALRRILNGKAAGEVQVVSGQPGRQVLETAHQGREGSMHPLPEGEYEVLPTDWRAGAGNWNASWGGGLGPFWSPLVAMAGERGAFGLHMDWNQASLPGTAGCLGFWEREEAETWLSWQADATGSRRLVADHGLGTVQSEQVRSPGELDRYKIFHHAGGTSASRNGQERKDAAIEVDLIAGKLAGILINGRRMDPIAALRFEATGHIREAR